MAGLVLAPPLVGVLAALLAPRLPAPATVVGGRGARLARVLVVLPAAVLGVAATSAPQYPHSVAVGEWNGRVVRGQSDGYHGADMIQQWLTTGDDGRTWSAVADPGPAGPAPVEVGQSGCVPDDARHCYRS